MSWQIQKDIQNTMIHRILPIFALVVLLLVPNRHVRASSLDSYNVAWDTPSGDSAGSMPLSNGEFALNAWVVPAGDLLFYIARTAAWSGSLHAPDYGAYGLIKVGRVRISLSPNPFVNATGSGRPTPAARAMDSPRRRLTSSGT
jgi:hypothetical protein